MNDDINPIQRVNPEAKEESYKRSYSVESPGYHPSPEVAQDYDEYCEDKHVKKLKTKSRRRDDDEDSSSSSGSASAGASSAIASAAVVVAVVAVIAIAPGAFGPIADMFDPVLGPIIEAVDPDSPSGGGSGGDDPDNPVDPEKQFSAEFSSIQPSDTAIRYSITIRNSDPGDSFEVTLKDRFTDRSESFTGESHRGEQTGLKAGMTYTLSILRNGATVASTSVTTERQMPDLYFELIYAECTCYADGQVHFQAEIRDGDGAWSDFKATLTDSDGAVSEIAITDLTAVQSIPVDDVLRAESAILRITCTEMLEDGTVQEKQLYSGQYEV